MARGGWRAGGGRPKGIIETRPRRRKKPSGDSDAEKIRQMLSMGIKAKANIYKSMLRRVGNNETLTLREQKLFLSIHEELSAEMNGEKSPAAVTDGKVETPLEFLLRVMNDPAEPTELRCRMAIAAAPYVHARRGEAGTGKKEAALERAKIAGSGKFASMLLPFRVVK
jgi:hypothetical protein